MHKKRKSSGVHASSRKPMKKCAMKMKQRKKRRTRKNLIHGRKPFIIPKQKTGGNDLHKLLGNDCGYNEGTICVLSGEVVLREWFFEHGRTNGHH